MAYSPDYGYGRSSLPPASSTAKPRREYLRLDYGEPALLALRWNDGRACQAPNGEDQVMYTLCDDRLFYASLDVAAKIRNAQIRPNQTFWLLKHRPQRRGQTPRVDLYLEDPTLLPEEEPLERDLRLSLSQAHAQRRTVTVSPAAPPEPTPAAAQPVSAAPARPSQGSLIVSGKDNTTRKRPGWAETLVNQTNELTDAYHAALEHAAQYGQAVKAEDVRSLLVTAFINLSQRGGRSNAA
jgi:hypothetical protein